MSFEDMFWDDNWDDSWTGSPSMDAFLYESNLPPIEKIFAMRTSLLDKAFVAKSAKEVYLPPKYYAEQVRFLSTLTEPELVLLASYTYVGDTIMNSILRGDPRPDLQNQIRRLNESFNLGFQEGPPGFIQQYVHAFMNVFKRAPVLKSPLTVYRGLKAQTVSSHRANEFISTSALEEVASEFTNNECCLLRLTLQPGVRTVWMEPITFTHGEHEVLVGGPATITQPVLNGQFHNAQVVPVHKGGRRFKTRKHAKKSIRI